MVKMNYQNQYNNAKQTNIGTSKKENSNNMKGLKFIIFTVIILQIGIFGLLAYGLFIPRETLGDQILKEVRNVAGVSQSLVPVDIVELDQNILNELRNGNSIQEEVYKDSQPGDYVVVYQDRMIIYRRDGRSVVYDGPSPGQIAQNNEVELLNKILARAKSEGLIAEGEEEVPQASVVEDPQQLVSQDPDFYSRAQTGDIIAVFPENQVIVLYNPNNDSIYNSGVVNTVIEPSNTE